MRRCLGLRSVPSPQGIADEDSNEINFFENATKETYVNSTEVNGGDIQVGIEVNTLGSPIMETFPRQITHKRIFR